ncbi:undecaprenyl diphosphate synthase family protein [Candidatus Woesearchaeota archaeon]|nr:undecaprenyl diphosphate synthase family protein [Candidatus Woesearchaeota archaeon]
MITHIAYQPEPLNITGTDVYESWNTRIEQFKKILAHHYSNEVIVATINILGTKYHESEIDPLTALFRELARWEGLQKNQTRVAVLGKWYTLPGRLVEAIKELIESTKDYDSTFLNMYLNYDSKEEMVDAVKNISRAVSAGKQDVELINQETLRDNTYTPHTPPPQKIVLTNNQKNLNTSLYDAPTIRIIISEKKFEELTLEDIKRFEQQDL